MNAGEAAEALMNVSGDAGDLEIEDNDEEVHFEEDSPHSSIDPISRAQCKFPEFLVASYHLRIS